MIQTMGFDTEGRDALKSARRFSPESATIFPSAQYWHDSRAIGKGGQRCERRTRPKGEGVIRIGLVAYTANRLTSHAFTAEQGSGPAFAPFARGPEAYRTDVRGRSPRICRPAS
jgi:hypothetical protein